MDGDDAVVTTYGIASNQNLLVISVGYYLGDFHMKSRILRSKNQSCCRKVLLDASQYYPRNSGSGGLISVEHVRLACLRIGSESQQYDRTEYLLMQPRPPMKLVGPLAARTAGLRLALALEVERHCSADEILQRRLIDLVAFVDVDGAPRIPFEAGVE